MASPARSSHRSQGAGKGGAVGKDLIGGDPTIAEAEEIGGAQVQFLPRGPHPPVALQHDQGLVGADQTLDRLDRQHLERRADLAQMASFRAPGIAAGEAMARYLWDLHIVAAASDVPSLEAWPPRRDTGGFLHEWLLGLFGLAIGEMWDLSALAADCSADGRYTCFLVSAPLNKRGGVGSPPNAIAFK